MTGALLSYKVRIEGKFVLSTDAMSIFDFSERLSKFSGIDFTRVFMDDPDELNGLLSYLSSRKNELREENFSEEMINVIITLNLISAFSLKLGFIKAEPSMKACKRPLKHAVNGNLATDNVESVLRTEYRAAIIIPTNMTEANVKKIYNLENLIKSLSQWRHLAGIWVVGRVPDRTQTQFNKFRAVQVIDIIDDSGPARARNLGIEEALKANSDLIIFMDDDVVNPISDSFESLCDRVVLMNDIYTPKIQSYGDTCYDIFHDIDGTLNGVYEQAADKKTLVYGTTCVMICPVKALREGLRFDENFPLAAGEDIDFCIKARNMGVKIIPDDTVIVKHDYGYDHTDYSLMKFILRFVRYGEGNSIIRVRQPQYFNSLTNALRRHTNSGSDKVQNIPEVIKSLCESVERCIR